MQDVEKKIDKLIGTLPARSRAQDSPLVKLRALFSILNKNNTSLWTKK